MLTEDERLLNVCFCVGSYLSQAMCFKFILFALNWIRDTNFHISENVLCSKLGKVHGYNPNHC